ncbi:hypothetical protein Back2_00110 [Nocardioides baekrokdamisoli]|uniref:Uncharacterized protein n=1 Tax=Nocardioides baekrokdamisoli TaxID=1804624 RepID=A0A3G9IX32_9ACTN|nr:hypothetical protein Back2_00110 [Nocardioides baekrokdamisoli]
MQPGELSFVDLHRAAEQRQPDRTLVDQSRQCLEDRVESAQLAQRHKGPTVRRVLPRPGADPGKLDSGPDRLVHGSDCAGTSQCDVANHASWVEVPFNPEES